MKSIFPIIFLLSCCTSVFSQTGFSFQRLGTAAINDTPFITGNCAGYPLETCNGYQYAIYYSADSNVCMARRKLTASAWETFAFHDYTFTIVLAGTSANPSDPHNTANIGICPEDGTIHLAFDHHNHPLHYRVSVKNLATHPEQFAWSAALFGPTTSRLGADSLGGLTYPRFVRAPNHTLQLYFRIGMSGYGDYSMYEYSPSAGWVKVGPFISRYGKFFRAIRNDTSSGRSPYLNGIDYDNNNRLQVTWMWREYNNDSISTNHDLMYAYSDDYGRTWMNNAGTQIGVSGTSTIITINSPGVTVYTIPIARSLLNMYGQSVDRNGRVHVIYNHVPASFPKDSALVGYYDTAARWFHYTRDNNGTWTEDQLPYPKCSPATSLCDSIGNLFVAGMDRSLFGASAASNWKDWHVIFSDLAIGGQITYDVNRWIDDNTLSFWSQGVTGMVSSDYKVYPCDGDWNFSSGGDGFTLKKDLQGGASAGVLNLSVTGIDPQLLSPDFLHFDTDIYKSISIHMKNGSTQTSGTIYWITYADTVWNSAKSLAFTTKNGETDYSTTRIDLSGNTAWSGMTRQIRIDPPGTPGSSVSIDRIKFASPGEWNFTNRMEGWTVRKNFATAFVKNALQLTLTGSSGQIASNSLINLDASDNKCIALSLTTNSTAGYGYLYWETDGNPFIGANSQAIKFTIAKNAGSSAITAAIDLSSKPAWTGIIKSLILEFPGAIGTIVSIEKIKCYPVIDSIPVANTPLAKTVPLLKKTQPEVISMYRLNGQMVRRFTGKDPLKGAGRGKQTALLSKGIYIYKVDGKVRILSTF